MANNKFYLKNIIVSSKNKGIRIVADHAMYPKKLGILIPFSSAIDRTMKLGALPM